MKLSELNKKIQIKVGSIVYFEGMHGYCYGIITKTTKDSICGNFDYDKEYVIGKTHNREFKLMNFSILRKHIFVV